MAKERRGKGGGTTYYDPAKDKWVAELKWVDELTGKTVKLRKYAATRKDAEELLADMVAQKARGLLSSPSRLTVRDFALEYLARKEREGVRPNTLRLLRHELGYALPSLNDPGAHDPLGRMPLQKVAPAHIRGVVDGLVGRYAPRTVRKVVGHLRALFREALHLELVARNPVEAVRVRFPNEEKAARALEPHEVARLLEAAEASRSKDMALLLKLILATGLRRGEALALQWRDIDLDRGEVRVWRAWARVGDKGAFTSPKTPTARRVVPLPIDLLRHLRARKEELLEKLSPEEVEETFLFGGSRPLEPNSFNHYLRRLAERAGLGRVRVHDLRHTWATLALSRGVPLEVVSERLGHASPTITLGIYRHLLEEERRGWVLNLSELLGSPRTNPQA